MWCICRLGMYAAHALYIRSLYAIESRWSPRVREMYVMHTPFAPWICYGQVFIRDIIRCGIAIHVRHSCALDAQLIRKHMRNSSAADIPANHLGDLTVYMFILLYAVRAQWRHTHLELKTCSLTHANHIDWENLGDVKICKPEMTPLTLANSQGKRELLEADDPKGNKYRLKRKEK